MNRNLLRDCGNDRCHGPVHRGSTRKGELWASARVAKLAHEPTRYLAAVQIGSIVAGFFAAAFGAAALAGPLASPLESAGVEAAAAESLAVVLITLLIT
jgi:CBS domain containing-hemolysin-like protein